MGCQIMRYFRYNGNTKRSEATESDKARLETLNAMSNEELDTYLKRENGQQHNEKMDEYYNKYINPQNLR